MQSHRAVRCVVLVSGLLLAAGSLRAQGTPAPSYFNPDQWETTITQSDPGTGYQATVHMSFDFTNTRMSFHVQQTAPVTRDFSLIFLYGSRMAYLADNVGGGCVGEALTSTMQRNSFYDFASGYTQLVSGSGPGSATPTVISRQTGGTAAWVNLDTSAADSNFPYSVVTIPLLGSHPAGLSLGEQLTAGSQAFWFFEGGRGPFSLFGFHSAITPGIQVHLQYFNNQTAGIKNPSVFNPPGSCPSVPNGTILLF